MQLEEQASFTCPFIGSCSFPPPNGDRDKGLHLFHCRLGGKLFLSDQGDHCLLGFTMICHTRVVRLDLFRFESLPSAVSGT